MKRGGWAILLALASWGCIGGGAGSGPTLGPAQIASVTATESLGNTGVTLESPGSLRAATDAQKALGVCESRRAPCPPTPPTVVRLAVGTDAGPAELDPSGKLNPVMDHRLVWAISWTGIECRLRGGVGAEDSPAAGIPKTCNSVAFVDAGTGDFLYQVTYESK